MSDDQTLQHDVFRPWRQAKYARLTTYKKDGSHVDTTVSIVPTRGGAYMRTYDAAGKVKRMRNFPNVVLAPSTVLGRVTGAPVAAQARLLDGEEAASASAALADRQPILHGILVPLMHRLRGFRTLHYQLTGGHLAAGSPSDR